MKEDAGDIFATNTEHVFTPFYEDVGENSISVQRVKAGTSMEIVVIVVRSFGPMSFEDQPGSNR